MPQSFYVPEGDGFAATPLTRGPWDPGSQHASPPAALLGRAVERHVARDDLQVARITFDLVRPVPIARVTVTTRTVWQGRSVWRVEASLAAATEVVRATALLLRTSDVQLPDGVGSQPPPTAPESGVPRDFFPVPWDVGYHTAMDARFVAGSFLDPGPATVWLRMRHPLLPDEEPSPLTRALMVADTGNGASATLDFRRFLFINTDLAVHLHRYPVDEWVCLDAATAAEPTGIGLTTSRLADRTGVIGRALQSLYIAER